MGKKESVKLIPLAPVRCAKNVDAYSKALKAALKNGDVCNIAVTGKHGAGKSSFLRTFFSRKMWRCFHRQPLWVSAASFKSLADKLPESDEIELWLLEQILFVENDKLMPFSRFGRIARIGLLRSCFVIIVWMVMGLSVFVLAHPETFAEKMSVLGQWNESWARPAALISLSVGSVAVMVLGLWAYRAFCKGCVSLSFKFGVAEVESKNETKQSVLNRNLEELIYFFRATKRWVVVFEDIDRIPDKSLFVKLRALNQVLNAACRSRFGMRSIKFIYAIRDDIFTSAAERVKFFDYIIPILPILGLEMVKNLFTTLLKKAGVGADVVVKCDKVIRSMAPFLSDRRLLHAICDEFIIMHSVLKGSMVGRDCALHDDKIMAMAIFKSFYPAEYARLTEKDNVLEVLLRIKGQKIAWRSMSVRKKIVDVDDKINQAGSDKIVLEKRALNREFLLNGFLKQIPKGVSQIRVPVAVGGAKLEIFDINRYYDPDHLPELVGKSFSFGAKDYYGTWVSKGTVEWKKVDQCVGGKSYEDRMREIERKQEVEVEKLVQERKRLLDSMGKVESMTLAEIVRLEESLVLKDEVSGQTIDLTSKSELRSLIECGFVEGDYRSYVTLYQDGDVSLSDYQYIVSIRHGDSCRTEYHIDNPAKVVESLLEHDFCKKEALNFDIWAWLIKTAYAPEEEKIAEELKEKCARILKGMLDCSGTRKVSVKTWLRFLQLKSRELSSEIFQSFVDVDTDLHIDVLDEEGLADDERIEFFIRLYHIITENGGELDIDAEHWEMLLKCANASVMLERLGASREVLIGAMKEGVKFKNYHFDKEPYRGFNEDLIANDAYEISIESIRRVLKLKMKLADDYEGRLLTVVAHSRIDSLINYIKKSFSDFVQNVYSDLPCQHDEKEVVAEYLNEDSIAIADKQKLVQKQWDMDIPFEVITSDDVVRLLWTHPRCAPPVRLVKNWFEGDPLRLALVDEFSESCKGRYQEEDLKALKESLKGSDDISEAK